LFVALTGDRFDGHAFSRDAVAAGATGLVVSAMPGGEPIDATVFVVDDTLKALQALSHVVRERSGATVVAITGSAGKTTTKEITAALLELRYRVFRNRGNLNNHIGLPLSLLELRKGPEMAVVELGMNHAGEIRTLVDIAQPDVRMWTNVGDAHIGHFGSREAVARAKAEILEGATAGTLVVVNADDPLVMSHTRGTPARVLTFGESRNADVRATAIEDRGFDGVTAHIETPAGAVDLTAPLPGRMHLSNVLAAVAVATHFDIPLEAVRDRVATLAPVARRGLSAVSPRGVKVIDDSYNASPAAVQASLAALRATPTAGRRVAVLGEMLELGEHAFALHEACGAAAARAADLLVAVGGPAAEGLVTGALDAGMSPSAVLRAGDSQSAAGLLVPLVSIGDIVLVKGSRGTRTDVIADRLRVEA
jgi:UDP-N-acetylmuramoyl-tripeptide--D-alanyl-D-alanine ligase